MCQWLQRSQHWVSGKEIIAGYKNRDGFIEKGFSYLFLGNEPTQGLNSSCSPTIPRIDVVVFLLPAGLAEVLGLIWGCQLGTWTVPQSLGGCLGCLMAWCLVSTNSVPRVGSRSYQNKQAPTPELAQHHLLWPVDGGSHRPVRQQGGGQHQAAWASGGVVHALVQVRV